MAATHFCIDVPPESPPVIPLCGLGIAKNEGSICPNAAAGPAVPLLAVEERWPLLVAAQFTRWARRIPQRRAFRRRPLARIEPAALLLSPRPAIIAARHFVGRCAERSAVDVAAPARRLSSKCRKSRIQERL
jgi:hypothetical protein